MKNTTKMKRIALICAILAALLLIAGCSFAAPAEDEPASQRIEFTGEVQVADEDTLRDALKSKGDCAIVLTQDVVITEELTVNGNKKLSGAGIIMDMRRVGSGESVLAIQKGAALVLDGATIDGNGVVNCVSVKAGGELDVQSGSLIYGYPYGLDVSGKASITDIRIDEALHTGINVAIFGEVDMLGGTISNNVYGIAVAEDGRMNLADGVVMDNSYASFIVNYGNMDIAGGKFDGAGDNAIENWGTLSIKGTEEKPVEICNGTKSALNSKNKSTLTAEHIKIYDMGWHGMCVEKNSTANLKDIYIENAGKSTLYVSSSKAKMEDVTVIGGAAYAVYGTKNADVTLNNVTIRDTNHRGIMNEDSTLNAENLVVENTAQHGVYAKGKAVTNINQATFSKMGVSAVAVAGGEATVTNTYIENTTKEGISVGASGKANVENVTIMNNGNFGIANYGGKVTAKNIRIYNTENVSIKVNDGGSFTGDELIIMNSYKNAISIEGGSSAIVTNCKINGTKNAAVYVEKSKLNMSYSTVKNSESYGIAAKNSEKVSLDHIEVYNSGEHGIGNINSYVLIGNTKIDGTRRCGIYTEGANSQTNMAFIEVYNAGSCGFGFNGGKEITARNVKIVTPSKEGIYAKAGAQVKKLDNVLIDQAGTFGIYTEGEGTVVTVTVDTNYNPENTTGTGVTILNPGRDGICCTNGSGTVTATATTITTPGRHGINISAGCTVNANGVTITDVTNTFKVNDKDTGCRGVSSDGTLVLKKGGLSIDNTKGHGVYLTAKAKVEGTNLTVRNAGDNGIFSEGANITIDGLNVLKTKNQAVQLKGGNVVLSNFKIENTGSAAVRPMNAAKVTLTDGSISTNTYGIAVDGTTETKVTNVTVEKSGSNKNALVNVAGSAKLELAGNCKIDGKNSNSVGVNVAASTATFTLNGATFTGTANDVALATGAKISLKSALTETLTVDPPSYEGGTVIAVNAGISNADFKASTKLIDVGSESSYVGEDGKLATVAASVNGVSYGSLEAAIDAAADGDTIKILAEASTITKPVTKAITLTADTAVTITVDGALNDHAFKVESGKTLTVEGDITVASTNTGKDVFYNEGTLNLTNVTILGGKQAINTRNGSFVTATNVTVESTANNGINVAGGANVTLSDVSVTKAGAHGISTGGSVNIVKNVTVDSPKKCGVYMTETSSLSGSGLTINNAGTLGIHADDGNVGNDTVSTINLSNLAVDKTVQQGVCFESSHVTLSNFIITATGSAAVRPMNNAKVTLTDGTICADTYGIAVDGTTETTVTNVTVEKTGTKMDALVNIAGSAKLELAGTTKIDGKNTGVVGVNVAASKAAFTMNGCTVAGADVVLVSGAKISLKSALTSAVSVKLDAYAKGTQVAVKGDGISADDFAASMVKLQPVDTTWVVDETGCLAYADHTHNYTGEVTKDPTCTEDGVKTFTCSICNDSYTESISTPGHNVTHVEAKIPTLEAEGNIEYWYCTVCNTYWNDAEKTNAVDQADVILPKVEAGNVAYMNGTAYATLEAAVAAANETTAADTITLLCDVTLAAQIKSTSDITITADKAVTITANMKNTMVNVAGGTLKITGASESAKITLAAGVTTTNIVHNSSNVILTNVHLAGNTGSTVDSNAAYGIYNNAGSVTATSVTITNIVKGDGINIRAGATASLDNVTISNTGRYGLKTFGTVNIYNTVNAANALSISNTYDHGIDIEGGGSINSHFANVPEGEYAIKINTTTRSSSIGILVRANCSLNLSHLSVMNTKQQGVYFYGTSATKTTSGSLSNFMVTGTGTAPVELAYSTVTLTNGIVDSAVVKDANSTLTENNVTVQ